MSIEINVLNAETGWPLAKPLFDAIWPPEVVAKLPWAGVSFARPELRVLIVSTLTRRNAEISFKALALGALDYVPKPDTNREITTSLDFRREVIRKVKLLGRARTQVERKADSAGPGTEPQSGLSPTSSRKRPFSLVPPRVVAIGSSTGGPEALASMLGSRRAGACPT